MPRIEGTAGDDNIDVTNDVGTENGSPQGTPVENIRSGDGNDTITVTDSTISENVEGDIGDDVITITDSTVAARVRGDEGNDTISVDGAQIGSLRLGIGDDVLNFVNSTVDAELRGDAGTDSLNLPEGTVVTDALGTFTVVLGESYVLSNGSFTLPTGQTVEYSRFENGTGIPCLVCGTLVETAQGERPVEDLEVGDFIPTQENGLQQIRWIGRRKFSSAELAARPNLRPVRILANSLGNGFPARDLLVSRQHRMLVRSVIAERMFDTSEVLIPAIKLTELPGVFVDDTVDTVEYVHILFDRHEIIYAERAPTESLFTGPEAMKSVSIEAQNEILSIFPEVAELAYEPAPARYIPPGNLQKKLVMRHLKNKKPLVRFSKQAHADRQSKQA